MATPDEMLSNLLKLPTEDRARIARELLHSLDGAADAGSSDEWEREVRARAASVADGTARLVDGETVLKDIAERIATIRSHR